MSINYAEFFYLQHYKSKKFLSFSLESDSYDFQNRQILKLENIPTLSSQFKILPAFKFQIETEKKIYLQQKVILACEFGEADKEGFIHYFK